MYERGLWPCRLKASLERLQRLTQSYADAMIDIFPQRASQLGRALGLDQDRITVSFSCSITAVLCGSEDVREVSASAPVLNLSFCGAMMIDLRPPLHSAWHS